MKREVVLILLTFLLTFISPIDAVSDQGLEWGIKEGVRYEYTLNVTDNRFDNVLLDCHYIHNFTLPQIENDVTALRMVLLRVPFTLTNGSLVHPYNGDFAYVAIGNWSHLTSLLPDSISFYTAASPSNGSYEVIDTDSSWGFLFTSDYEICDVPIEKWVHGWILHLEFSKVDGVLDYSFFQWLLPDSVADVTVEVIRTDTIYPSNPTLIIAGGAIVSILIISVTFMRKRK
ncbi:MAG: hypothetical protein ACFFF9_03990 [Candidatus Thorarchaeota archaeon]